ncbi:MAG: tetratricopeptide repeat protein [Bacteroidaceae bacterium]|nr:tetratricopeptide repeat protein [Bacteroidaceae bacterium]
MERQLIDYIRRPDSMDKQAIAHLRALVEQYPYFHSARILLLQALYRSHDSSYNAELRRSAVMVPNRQAIFHLVEEKSYTMEEERKKFNNEDMQDEGDRRTENLIDNFLQTLPQETSTSGPLPIDATQDYIGYLMQQDEKTAAPTEEKEPREEETPGQETETPVLMGNDIIENFLESGGGGPIRLAPSESRHTSEPEELPIEEEEETSASGEFLTETLAGIYIKQGKYESAAKIIRQISLNNPKKNRYFADQLRFLEKLIINSKNKQKQ